MDPEEYVYIIGVGGAADWEAGRGNLYFIEDRNGEIALPIFTTPEGVQGGSLSEADDAVQEAWLRFNRSDVGGVENLGGWLTTVVSRVCLDVLRSRRSRREGPLEEPLGEHPGSRSFDPTVGRGAGGDPEHEVLVADSVGPARTTARSLRGFGIKGGKIVEIAVIADPTRLRRLDVALLKD